MICIGNGTRSTLHQAGKKNHDVNCSVTRRHLKRDFIGRRTEAIHSVLTLTSPQKDFTGCRTTGRK